ncbi:Golgi transport complex subunit COG8 [Spizellomyces punctatus DAOM BR117]|uniref:Conserved oligomeric Golgi complex subunit 8 n=1 Tax=Spizellomyces punctatus (strain DAOM BR117) TaxID=645134 RepID=A0A0L0HQW9_SPIPD|nr:Golgi transport complex subunit COG8 [Spizellomyces punctatus DAOM BR117]KND03234.1 hypothetical protein SPPG_02288 [Spizellomyces punctatus DAOM BR117]|eukprot:XP_016611273.1 hypothetical protein SPPG_02288 [Spizellomyces punctatus DAOM BR117]
MRAERGVDRAALLLSSFHHPIFPIPASMERILTRNHAINAHTSTVSYGHDLLVTLLEETATETARLLQAPPTPSTPTPQTPQQEHAQVPRRPSSMLLSRKPSTFAAKPETLPAHPTRKVSQALLEDQHVTSIERGPAPAAGTEIVTKELFADAEYQSYLDYLTSCSLESLKNEPVSLTKEATRLQQQLADLAYTEYRSFLRANECTRAFRDTFEALESRLDSLTSLLPDLERECTSFASSSAADVLKQRRREHLVLNQHSKLVEILEIPQLMDTLIRNGYYEEAMDLHTHVQRLLLRFPHFELLKSVADDLDEAIKVMLAQLVNLFAGDVKLPLCIRVVGYLRRMEALPEPELRLTFLQQRDKFFRKRIEEGCGKEPSGTGAGKDHLDYLKKYIDVWTCRECFFDIVAQYRGIFSDSLNTQTSHATTEAHQGKSTSALLYDATAHPTLTQSILTSYVTYRIEHLCTTLKTHLPHVTDASQVASLSTQTMYFGMSLGWVGIDLRGLVGPLFEETVAGIVEKIIGESVRDFVGWVKENSAVSIGAELGTPTGRTTTAKDPFLTGIYVKHSTIPNAEWTTPRTGGGPQPIRVIPAPTPLLAHPPLAHLLNAFFTAYNNLRALPAPSLRTRMESYVQEKLILCAETLDEGIASGWDGWSEDGRKIAKLAAAAWIDMLVPNVMDGLQMVFGGQKAEGASQLEKIVGPLKKWLVDSSGQQDNAESQTVLAANDEAVPVGQNGGLAKSENQKDSDGDDLHPLEAKPDEDERDTNLGDQERVTPAAVKVTVAAHPLEGPDASGNG